MSSCYICSNHELKLILDLGKHPPPLNFLTKEEIDNNTEESFHLQLYWCKSCGLVQLGKAVDPNKMFRKYVYESGISTAFKNHLSSLAKTLVEKFNLKSEDLVIDIASNDGTLLEEFKKFGIKVLGVEPSNVAEIAMKKGIPTVHEFFDENIAKEIFQKNGNAKIITATNVLAHVEKLDSFMKGIKLLLDDSGIFVSESHYLIDLIEKLEYDTIYHEHLRYYGLRQLIQLFENYEMEVFDAQRIDTHGGSIRIFASNNGKFPMSSSIKQLLKNEDELQLTSLETLKNFARNVQENKQKLRELLLNIKSKKFQIAGISAPARSTTILNFCEIDSSILDFIAEKGKLKIGKFTPGTHIQVVDDKVLTQNNPEYALLLSWHLKDSIITKIRKDGYKGKIIVPLPQVQIIEP